MKTLADFKRDVASGKIKLEMVERFGKTGEEIPERCRGIRAIQSVNTVEIMLETADGLTSSLDFPPAKLIEYDGKSLTIRVKAEENVNNNWDLFSEALDNFEDSLSSYIYGDTLDFEEIDVVIRCYLLRNTINVVVDELKEQFKEEL